MGMTKYLPVAAVALLVAACGNQAAAPAEETAASLGGGLYELTSEVTELTPTEKGVPATKLKQGDKSVVKACVAADGKPAAELLAEAGDKCGFTNSYVRNGRMNVQLTCTREGVAGQVLPTVQGDFKADSFEGEIASTTYFAKDNYRMTRKVSAHRVGDCPAAPPAKA